MVEMKFKGTIKVDIKQTKANSFEKNIQKLEEKVATLDSQQDYTFNILLRIQ